MSSDVGWIVFPSHQIHMLKPWSPMWLYIQGLQEVFTIKWGNKDEALIQ